MLSLCQVAPISDPIGTAQNQSENRQGATNNVDRSPVLFDLLVKSKTKDNNWDGAQGDHPTQARVLLGEWFAFGETSKRGQRNADNILPKVKDGRHQRPELNNSSKGGAGILPANQFGEDADMSGAAYRQPFSQSLNDSINHRLEARHWFHNSKRVGCLANWLPLTDTTSHQDSESKTPDSVQPTILPGHR